MPSSTLMPTLGECIDFFLGFSDPAALEDETLPALMITYPRMVRRKT